MKAKICPVILCGGSGKRLWPLSRACYPKQFIDFGSGTLFEQTLDRVGSIPGISEPIVVCNEEHRCFVFSLLKEHSKKARIILEPEGRNTAPAIALAAFLSQELDKEALLLVLPSDHFIESIDIFHRAIIKAYDVATKGRLVTFGIVPTRPEKGFGYIQPGDILEEGVYTIASFIEKPNTVKAKEFFQSGDYFWNSGMFLFHPSLYLDELKRYDLRMFNACEYSWNNHKIDMHMEFFRPEKEGMALVPSGSIDNIIMEKTKKSCMVVLNTGWSDFGSWEAFYDAGKQDINENVIQGDVVTEDVHGCYINTNHRLLCALGIHDLIIVETEDAVLVVDRERSQEVKDLLEKIQSFGRAETEIHNHVFRPWGSYKVLFSNDQYKVKKIIVYPGESLSLQKHQYRSEHWIVVQGIGHAEVDGSEYIIEKNQSLDIPQSSIHRLKNSNNENLEIIEVQSGSYLGEDDIVRFEDLYGRIEK